MIGTLTNIVAQLTANGDTFLFDYGKKGYANLAVDENTQPFVIYDTESSLGLDVHQSGFIGESGSAFLGFFYKSELDWTPKQHYDNCILPAINAVRQFISLCQASDLINSISISGKGKEQINLFNVNASGVTFTFEIELNVDKTVCASANPSTNGSPVTLNINGSAIEVIDAGTIFPLTVTLDGVEAGTYDDVTDTWELVSGVVPCADATVRNSDFTYKTTVASGGTLELPDTTYNIYLDGVLNQTFAIPTLKNETINISL